MICAYLESKHPSPALYPEDSADFAKVLFLEEYADTRMVEVIGGILFERVMKPQVLHQQGDRRAGRAESSSGELPPVLDYVESQLPADRETVLPRFGIADVALGAQLRSLAFAASQIDAARWPRTARY